MAEAAATQPQWMGAIKIHTIAKFGICVYMVFFKEKKSEFLGEISHSGCQTEHI